jgi:hypothetical protein
MKKITLFFLFCLFLSKSFAQIRVKSSVHLPIYFSYGYFQNGDKKGIYTKGWWKIVPNETITINVPISFQNPIFFYSYISDNGKFQTKSTTKGIENDVLLVDPNNHFSIVNAHMQYVIERNPNYVWRYFTKRVLTVEEVSDETFNINITYDDL